MYSGSGEEGSPGTSSSRSAMAADSDGARLNRLSQLNPLSELSVGLFPHQYWNFGFQPSTPFFSSAKRCQTPQ